jgi:hypothetical protein
VVDDLLPSGTDRGRDARRVVVHREVVAAGHHDLAGVREDLTPAALEAERVPVGMARLPDGRYVVAETDRGRLRLLTPQ